MRVLRRSVLFAWKCGSVLFAFAQFSLSHCVRADEGACAGLDIESWTQSDESHFPGYHVMCVGVAGCQSADGGDEVCKAGDSVPMTVFWGGDRRKVEEWNAPMPASFPAMEEMLSQHGPSPNNPERHGRVKAVLSKKGHYEGLFAFYSVRSSTEVPQRIGSPSDLAGGLVLVYEGGSFLWPGIEVGFLRNISLQSVMAKEGEDALHLTIKTMSMRPLVVEISNFLNEEQRSHMIDMARPTMVKSPAVRQDHGLGHTDYAWRTSLQAFVLPTTPILKLIDRLVAGLTNVRATHGEPLQVLRYGKGQLYGAHTDYMGADMYKDNAAIASMTENWLFNRLATVFFYLSDVEEGGETAFPRAGGLGVPDDTENCHGMKVKPESRKVIIFYSLGADGNTDPLSAHVGCEVKRGTKWSANKWLWNKRMWPMNVGEDE